MISAQNFIYTSRVTELGRGKKTEKMSDLPEWTPGPGTYPVPTDFVNKRTTKVESHTNENGEVYEEVVEHTPHT